MRFGKKYQGVLEGDLTPMIDMTFQLIAFFMVLINLNDSEQERQIMLPESQLARPPEEVLEMPITLHVDDQGREGNDIILSGQYLNVDTLGPSLDFERDTRTNQGMKSSDILVIIRADMQTQTGKVQKVIEICQQRGLEKFALRAQGKEG